MIEKYNIRKPAEYHSINSLPKLKEADPNYFERKRKWQKKEHKKMYYHFKVFTVS